MRVIIADSDIATRENTKQILEVKGYKVVAEASDGFDAIKLCRQHKPDVILIDIIMPLLDGISVAQVINNEDIAGAIVFLTSNYSKDIINKVKKVGTRGYILKPLDEKYVIPTIEIAVHTGNELKNLKKENQTLEQKFEDRKIIDKAKGILMKKENISEDEAYAKIRKYSMEKRVSMREIAEFLNISNKF